MDKNIRLETERLIIREWRESDVGHYLTLSKDVGYSVFSLPGQFLVKDETEALERIKQRQSQFDQRGLGKFLIFHKSTEEFIGTCGMEPYKLDGQDEVELGYRLLLKQWGKGYATEAAGAVLQYGLSQLKLPRVIAFAILQNPQSLKILEKLRFRFLKIFEHAGLPHKLYEITATDLAKEQHPEKTLEHTRYAIILDKVPNKETSRETIQRHIEHLRKLEQEGRLVLCGPFTDHASGMVVVKAKNKDEAIAIAKADPFVAEGVRTQEVRTWLLACADNNYLG